MLHNHCLCSASAPEASVYRCSRGNLRCCQCDWAVAGRFIDRQCVMAMVVGGPVLDKLNMTDDLQFLYQSACWWPKRSNPSLLFQGSASSATGESNPAGEVLADGSAWNLHNHG